MSKKYIKKTGLHYPELKIILKDNPHIVTDLDYKNIQILFKLVNENRNSYFNILNKIENKYLTEWIKLKIPNLFNQQAFVPNFGTMCYWIFNGLTDFPKCPTCKKIYGNNKNISIGVGYNSHCSNTCKTLDLNVQKQIQDTCINKYGCNWPSSSSQSKQSYINTCQKKYGVNNIFQLESTIIKSKKTCKEKYNDENYRNNEKRKQTCIKLYNQKVNGNAISKTLKNLPDNDKEKWISNIKSTKNKKYGNKNYNNKEKAKETCLKKYGTLFASQSDIIKQHTRETFLKKYGYDHNWKVPEIRKQIVKNKKFYIYDGISFDSKAEICFYIGCRDGGIKIEREPESLMYIYDNKEHLCFYDFRINDNIKVEIKGNYFFEDKDRTKKMICPWKPSEKSRYTQEYLNNWAEAKHQCMLNADVIFITSEEYNKYIDYVEETYGQNFLAQFYHKRNKNKNTDKF